MDFHYAMSLSEQMYGVQMKEDNWEEIALVAWALIGNKRVRIYRYRTSTQSVGNGEYVVTLPCNVDQIEAVTSDYEDFQKTHNIDPRSKRGSFITEQYIESQKRNKSVLYAKGSFLNYQRVGNQLIFNEPHRIVNILYKGEILDDNGLPDITDKEALAIATYTAYVFKYKEGLLTNNQNIINIANTLKQSWLTQCDQARTDYHYSQNDWNEILDAKVTWNRKIYNNSYKMFNG